MRLLHPVCALLMLGNVAYAVTPPAPATKAFPGQPAAKLVPAPPGAARIGDAPASNADLNALAARVEKLEVMLGRVDRACGMIGATSAENCLAYLASEVNMINGNMDMILAKYGH